MSARTTPLRPLLMAPNTIEHFYAGGSRIAELRGLRLESDHRPEEWLAATVARAGEPGVGPARTVGGDMFADVVADDLHGWVGDLGPDTGVLVKLLDAGQRLPVHVHPDRSFASSHLGCGYGKTEAWYVLDADDGATVHLGWTEDVDPDELAERRDRQDSDWMLERLHRIPVRAGDGILVPAGQPHAIGAGVFVVEAQEPTDFSILLEWSITTATREESHLGLGFDRVMTAVSHRALAPDALDRLRRHLPAEARADSPLRCLTEQADPFFRVDVLAPPSAAGSHVGAGYAVLVVLAGAGELVSADGTTALVRGDVCAVPAALGDWQLRGDVRAVLARPGDEPADMGGSR
jgi:mannose-6-phosphate isomerase